MEAIKVVNKESSREFEKECNDLTDQGYFMVSCYCGYFNPNLNSEYTPRPIWYAVFTLPENAQYLPQIGITGVAICK